MESWTHFLSIKWLQHTFALGKKKKLWSKSSNYNSPLFISLPSHSSAAVLAVNVQCFMLFLLYNILVKLCTCVYPNRVVLELRVFARAGKRKIQYHRLHRIFIPHISVSFPDCGVTGTLPGHVSPSVSQHRQDAETTETMDEVQRVNSFLLPHRLGDLWKSTKAPRQRYTNGNTGTAELSPC